MADSTENTDNSETSEYKEEPRHLACPYCGGQLYATTEFSGGYMGTDEVVGFECFEIGCSAEWGKDGKLTSEPYYQRYPDSYQKPQISQPANS